MEYHKIPNVWERDPSTNYKTLIELKWSTPELAGLRELPWLWTEKVDGTNIRLTVAPDGTAVNGRSDEAQLGTDVVHLAQEPLALMQRQFAKVLNLGGTVHAFCEGYGAPLRPGGGKYRHHGIGLALFDVAINGAWQPWDNVKSIAQSIGVDPIHTLGVGTLIGAVELTRAGFNSAWGEFPAEGLVMRPPVELLDRQGKRIVAKVKTRDLRAKI